MFADPAIDLLIRSGSASTAFCWISEPGINMQAQTIAQKLLKPSPESGKLGE
ncbi:hypothetical protein [Sphingomonas metalli]|uniref:hypothetical protein n=1 Tax=Sphingomonas metalli TaxID=1779358 RepID=UPI00166BEA6F|nr:hypothetical protein [Sphingomonas metalli]